MLFRILSILCYFMERSSILGEAILKGWPSLSPGLVRGTTSHAPTLGQRQRGPTLKGLNQSTTDGIASTPSGLYVPQPTQGRRWCANPRLNDCNPVGDLCKSRSSARKSREGLLKVARRFIAGYRSKSESRPGGTVEIHLWKCPSCVPTGRSSFRRQNPAMNGRATFNHSYGMIGSQTFAEVSVGVAAEADISGNRI